MEDTIEQEIPTFIQNLYLFLQQSQQGIYWSSSGESFFVSPTEIGNESQVEDLFGFFKKKKLNQFVLFFIDLQKKKKLNLDN